MNSKRILNSLVLALLISGGATWILSRKFNRPPAPVHIDQAFYVAPSRPLQADEALTAENIELIAWPGDIPLDGAFRRSIDVIGRQPLFPLAKGQPILDRDLSAMGSSVGLAGKIPDGMRAVALRSDEVVGVAGFLVPGSRLDVLVTFNPDHNDPVNAVVVQNAQVVAAGHQIEPDPEGKSVVATVVTLLLTPEQAQRAVLASTQGAIHFILRNGGDSSLTLDAPVYLSQLSSNALVAPMKVIRHDTIRVAPAQKPREIETIFAGGEADQKVHGAGQ